MGKSRLWLLAHQDDEVLGLHLHSKLVKNIVVYLTDGVRSTANYESHTRATEAMRSWNVIDRNAELIFFGIEHELRDGELGDLITIFHLRELVSLCENRNIDEIVTLDLEGGHQDHDVASLIAEVLCNKLSIDFFCFPGYRAIHKTLPLYIVMSSSSKWKQERTHSVSMRLKLAVQAFTLMKNYKSQFKTWIGLGPFVILKYLIGKPSYSRLTRTNLVMQDIPTKILYSNRKQRNSFDYESLRMKMSRL